MALASEARAANLSGGHDVDWHALTAKLPTGRSEEQKEARRKLFRKARAKRRKV